MILQTLNDYYVRLQNDPEVDIAPFGFSRQKISFCVTLNEDGTLAQIDDLREQSGKNLVPKPLVVPGGAKPSGSGVNPCFLWDNSAYMLGYKPDDEKPERTQKSFEAFRQFHQEVESQIEDPEFSAVCRFLDKWNPVDAAQHEVLMELSSGFGVFRIRSRTHYVHDRDAVKQWWTQQLQKGEDKKSMTGQCLVTGKTSRLARLHEPKIKGVLGAQSAGAALVSFNLDAFSSYGKQQGFNSPVSEAGAFQYCTALNHLLSDRRKRLQIGDATTVFWTAEPSPAENLFGWIFEPTIAAEDDSLKTRIETLLKQIADGDYPEELGDRKTPFYVLGLSPNASRLSVRFWYESTIQELVDHLHQHFVDLKIVRSDRDPEFPDIWRLLRETARERKNIPPLLSGAVMRSVLMGTPYPQILYTAVLRRIRADQSVSYLRAAILKAFLNRQTRLGIQPLQKEIEMSLDPARPEPAYHMGRFFAELEKTQEDALPGLNATIKDRYFGAASATPASVFPRLIRLSQHHLGKLEKGLRTHHERRIRDICGQLDDFPSHLNLQDQGLFAIGYYHQRQDIFTKKTNPKPENEE